MVADLIRRVGEHEDDFFRAPGNPTQADRKTVAGKYGKNNADRIIAVLGPDIACNIVDSGIIALRTGHDRFGHGDHIAVVQGKAVLLRGCLLYTSRCV